MRLKKVFLFLLIMIGLGCFFPKSCRATNAHFYLHPSSGSYSSEFNLEIRINSGGQDIGGADVFLEFPQNLVKIANVTKGNSFPELSSLIKNEQGKLRLTAYFPIEQANNSFNQEDGLIATIKFLPQNSGTASITFLCSNQATNDSNIVQKTTNQDIIDCNSNINGSYTLSLAGVGSYTTATPTPTPTSTISPVSPTPTIPTTGIFTPTIGFFSLGFVLFLSGLVWVF